MRKFTLLALLALCACGGAAPVDRQITVRRYEDVSGTPTPYPDSLGLTYFMEDKGAAEHGAAGWNCLINEILRYDVDSDKIVRVIAHELLHALGAPDDGFGPGSYSWDSDTLPPFAPVPPPEAEWLSSQGPGFVHVKDSWLEGPTNEAIERLNAAAGTPVLYRR